MKRYFNICLSITVLMLVQACTDFDDLNTNPDATTVVTPAMMATGQLRSMINKGDSKGFYYDMMLSKMIAWTERQEQMQYNFWDQAGFGTYTSLTSAAQMVEVAADVDKDVYQGLFLFMKAYRLFDLSMLLGSIPYSEALQGATGLKQPKYDSQKEVMRGILADLDEAYKLFSNTTRSLGGDIFYGGDPSKWAKATVALQLKILIHLSKKEADSDLNIKAKFAALAGGNALFTSNSDNLQLVYTTESASLHPLYEPNNRFSIYPSVTNMVIDPLKQYEDYRLFYYCSPSEYQLDNGVSADSWDAYMSINPSDPYDATVVAWADKKVSNVNQRFIKEQTGQPTIVLGYAEQQFILAEAALRGWIGGNANDYYLNGIAASMDFTKSVTPDNPAYHQGRVMTPEYIAAFKTKPELQLSGNAANFESDLEKIITQKYLDNFMQFAYESYYTYRRTGYPVLPINPATSLNAGKPDQLPMRYRYSDNERSYNVDNLLNGINELSPKADEINSLMWILQ